MFTVSREVEMVKLNFEVVLLLLGSKFLSDNIILRKRQTNPLLDELETFHKNSNGLRV